MNSYPNSCRARKSNPRTEWQGIVLLVVAIILFALLDIVGGAEPQTLKLPPGPLSVRLLTSPPAGADVSWEVKQPESARFITFENQQLFISHSDQLPDKKLIVVSDVISWNEAEKRIVRDKTQWTILVDPDAKPDDPPKPPDPKPDPPKPDPPKPPDVKPPVPVPDDSTRVLIIFESQFSTRMPPAQRSALFGEATDQWLDQNCAEWRRVDENTAITNSNSYWAHMLARKRTQLPWFVVVKNKVVVYEGPVPPTASEFLAQLKQHGGK